MTFGGIVSMRGSILLEDSRSFGISLRGLLHSMTCEVEEIKGVDGMVLFDLAWLSRFPSALEFQEHCSNFELWS